MLQLPDERRPPITPQLAIRVAILGGFALALFAIIFFRLWFLQVLSGDRYLAEANNNRVRDIRVPAPRGNVVDRHGTTLVDNRVSIAVQVEPRKLPPAGPRRADLYRRLSEVIGIPADRIEREVRERSKALPYANVTVKADAPRDVYAYLFERQQQFPGVTVSRVYLRQYPHRDVGAHLFGTVGQISPGQLKLLRFRGVPQGTIVGQGGIEYVYDRYLRGHDGATRVQIDALGRPKGELSIRQPAQGRNLRLSIDFNLQKAGMDALRSVAGIGRGAFVAIDPRNGEMLALGSLPTFDPNEFAKPLSQARYRQLSSEANGAPLFDRSIQGAYPTGSTFKLITATAALQGGLITPDTVISDPGSISIGGITFQNSGGTAYGSIALSEALKVSSDVFFYTVGMQANDRRQTLQKWARRLGIGRPTGVDLPGEFTGLLPTPDWRNRLYRRRLTDRPWSVGDNVNLAVGQGDLQATPLQLAVAYATVANGGRVITPHIGLTVEDASGRTLQEIEPGPARRISISPRNRAAILDGLRRAASEEGGTSADVFAGFGHPVHGKTGTAERPPHGDQSWYAAYSPDPQRPLVVVATVEQGGYGAEAAAPAVRLILSQWFGVQKRLVVGQSRSR
jgi:penicillin-binding protein 2